MTPPRCSPRTGNREHRKQDEVATALALPGTRGSARRAPRGTHAAPVCSHTQPQCSFAWGVRARARDALVATTHARVSCRSVGSSHLLELLTTSPRTAAHTLCLRGRAQLGGAPRYLCTPHPRPRARARRRACPPRAAHDAQQPHPVTRALAGNWGRARARCGMALTAERRSRANAGRGVCLERFLAFLAGASLCAWCVEGTSRAGQQPLTMPCRLGEEVLTARLFPRPAGCSRCPERGRCWRE